MVLIDTGPFVALEDAREEHHPWAVEAFGSVAGPVLTCAPVLSETAFLLRRWAEAFDAILEHVEQGRIQIEPLTGETPSVRKLMRRYRSVPMSYADACLVRMSEMFPDARLMTLDSDFTIYRRFGRQVIPLLAPYRQG